VLLALVVIIGLFVLGGRWAARHINELRARSAKFLERPRVRKQRERYDRQISFLMRRFDPTARYGLYLTAGLVFSTLTAAIFGVVLEDIVAPGDRPFFDTRLLLFFRDHRTPALNDAMRALTTLGGSAFVAVVLAVAAVVAYIRTRETRWAAFFTATTIGAIALPKIVKVLVARPRPDFDPLVEVGGYAFPSGHATAAAAMCCALAFYMGSGRSLKARVWIWTAAGAIAFIVGLTRVYLGVHWPTDVIGGLALGAFWTLITGTATSLLADRRQARG
jgi:undecaprenyl-diphosphatase